MHVTSYILTGAVCDYPIRFTTSSNSSGNSCQSVCSTTDQECNPFLPDIVNRMLNSVGGIPEDTAVPVFTCTTPAPAITPGHILPSQVFHSTSLLTKSRFSDIYLVQGTFGKKVLQVRAQHGHEVFWLDSFAGCTHHMMLPGDCLLWNLALWGHRVCYAVVSATDQF